MIQQVRHEHEENGLPVLYAPGGDSRSHVGLATAAGACKHHPALGVFGESPGGLERGLEESTAFRVPEAPLRISSLKGDAAQGSQVAVAVQAGRAPVLGLLLLTAAREDFAEIRMGERDPTTDPAPALADWAFFLALLRIRGVGPVSGGIPKAPPRWQPFENIAQTLHRPFLPSPTASVSPRRNASCACCAPQLF